MSEAELLFIAEAIRHARSLPFRQALTFLEGMRHALGSHPALPTLVQALGHFSDGDGQLELIATGQLKLDLPTT